MLFLLQLPSPFLLETAEHATVSLWTMHRPGMTYSPKLPCSVENCLDDKRLCETSRLGFQSCCCRSISNPACTSDRRNKGSLVFIFCLISWTCRNDCFSYQDIWKLGRQVVSCICTIQDIGVKLCMMYAR